LLASLRRKAREIRIMRHKITVRVKVRVRVRVRTSSTLITYRAHNQILYIPKPLTLTFILTLILTLTLTSVLSDKTSTPMDQLDVHYNLQDNASVRVRVRVRIKP
jgi:hypothetical protein